MFVSKSLLLTVATFGLCASAVQAERQWILAGETGVKPNRSAVFVDIASVKIDETKGEYGPGGQPYLHGPPKKSVNASVDAAEAQLAGILGKTTGPFMSIELAVVHESADQPEFSNMTVRNFCDRNINDIAGPFTYWRNDKSSKEQVDVVFPIKTEVMSKVLELTCGDTEAAFAKGFKVISGSDTQTSLPLNYPWEQMWTDGVRPAYQITQSQKDAAIAENAAMAAKTQAMLNTALGKAENTARGLKQNLEEDDAFWKDQAERRKYRPKSKLNPFLEGWLRKDEQYIVQNLGVPDGVYVAGNSRFLTYFNGWSQVFTTTDVQSGQVLDTSEQSYVCELTMELQDNQMIDFKFKGNSCGFGEFAGR
jgi:hypothetical protein